MAEDNPSVSTTLSTECKIAIVGAGLVGCLQAYYLHRRGYSVTLFEKRRDLRQVSGEEALGRSINLALSYRGRVALQKVDLEAEVLSTAVRVVGRMVHDLDGKCRPMLYGTLPDEANYSVDRRKLNELLLGIVEKAGCQVKFEHKLAGFEIPIMDANQQILLSFSTPGGGVSPKMAFDFVFGCDGAFSAVRASVISSTLTNFSIKYISSGYRELTIPARSDGTPLLEPLNYLHLWARTDFMFMALPNLDNSYTCTLFAPFEIFGTMKTSKDVVDFFSKHFPDALELLGGAEGLTSQFDPSKKPGLLPVVNVTPHEAANGRILLMGDAAHAMVPFYAQGMNSGFEDCVVFDEALSEQLQGAATSKAVAIANAIRVYSKRRVPDAFAICELAERNYCKLQ